MTAEPPRLKHSPELGAVIRAASDATVPPERLAANAAGIKALIVGGASTAVWKLLVPLLLLLALATAIVIKLVARAPEPPAPIVAVSPPPDAGTDAALDAPPPDAAALDAPPPDAAPLHHHHVTVAPDAGVPDAPPAKGELAAQIELYQAARDAGQRGDPARGIALIDELLAQYPATPLRAEVDLTRADFLARANRLDEATRALEALAADPAHTGRRGELLRTLGDLYRRQNDCAHAVAAYDRALAEHLSDRDRADVVRGRDRCTHP